MKTSTAMLSLTITLLSILRQVSAQYYTCSPQGFNQPEWTCDVCGDYGVGNSPIRCGPGNATFDDLAVGSISTTAYQRTTWRGFSVVDGSIATGASIRPYSEPHYARLPAGQVGLLDMTTGGTDGGTLYSLHYGCTEANTLIPAACQATFAGVCQYYSGAYLTSTTTLTFIPPTTANGSMAYARAVGPQWGVNSVEWCTNFTIKAKSPAGSSTAVDLYIDEVLHSEWAYQNV